MARKSEAPIKCPITRGEFIEESEPLKVTISSPKLGAHLFGMTPKDSFGSGSFGWAGSEKRTFIIGGKAVKVQIGINITIIDSKHMPPASGEVV